MTEPDDRRLEELEGLEGLEDSSGAPAIPAAALAASAARVVTRTDLRRQADRDIWSLTWPVIFSGMLASAVSLIDIAMLGRLGTEALAAVGYATQFFFLAQSLLMAVGIACVALMSRAVGAGNPARAREDFAACLLLSAGAAIVITVVAVAFPEPLLRLLNAQESVIERAVPYFRLTLGASLLLSFSFLYESAFRAAGDTRTPMLVAGAVTVAKVALNFVLIFGLLGFPRLDLVGAGLATLASQLLAVVVFLAASRRRGTPSALRLRRRDFRRCRTRLREAIRLCLPAVGERLLMNIAIMSYFAILGKYGPVAIAAYTVGIRILSFSWIPGMGFSVASATLVGQALGAEDPDAAARAGWRSVRLCLIVSGALGIFFLMARIPLAHAFTDDPSVIEALQPFMLILGCAQPFLALHFTLGGALRGAGDTVTPLWAAALGNWGLRVPIAFVSAHVLDLGVVAVWSALIFDHIARAVWMGLAFHRGRWRKKIGLDL